ncbi:MAG: glycosyltransferase [Phycisphaerae bacterium]
MSELRIDPPTMAWPMEAGGEFRASWGEGSEYVNDEHGWIYEDTRGISGEMERGAVEKLYEMAFHNGLVMLEIGAKIGRGAVVGLRGAKGAEGAEGVKRRGVEPQFYGVTGDAEGIPGLMQVLEQQGVAERALLFGGGLAEFRRLVPIRPTMVFLHGDGGYSSVWRDLHHLSEMVAAGTPMLCGGYAQDEGVKRAVEEWVKSGFYKGFGQFGGAALLVASGRGAGGGAGGAWGLPGEVFAGLRRDLVHGRGVGGTEKAEIGTFLAALGTFRERKRALAEGRGWPFGGEMRTFPRSLPDGKPWPRISIVTPAYNYGRFLEETILSVKNQNYPNVEHIVIDGGSTDNTREVIEKYRHLLAYSVSEKDRGQSDAINKGFAKATGEIFTWVNADDMLAPGALHGMALAFWSSGADMVAGICEQYRNGRLLEKHMTSCGDGELPAEELLDLEGRWMAGQFFMQPEVMFTRELWERAGGHVEVGLHYSMDYELWLRFAAAKAKLHVVGRSVCWFRHHEEQKTSAVEKFLPELTRVRDEFAAKHGLEVRPLGRALTKGRIRFASVSDLGFQYGAGIGQRRIVDALMAGGHEVISFAAAERVHSEVTAGAEEVVEAVGRVSPDVVLVGNTHGAGLSAGLVGMVAEKWPTGVVLHDLWHVTGRCAYTGGCEKYVTGCDERCPTAGEYPVLAGEKIRAAWEEKYAAYRGERAPLLLANSAWTAGIARRGLEAQGCVSGVEKIVFGIELDVFRPMDKRFCRRMLGLPEEGFLILSSGSTVTDPRKGVRLLAEALKLLELPNVVVACVGNASRELEEMIPGVRGLGYLKESSKLALAYGAADLFVGPSVEEAFGQVFAEAAACGTASVGFAVGGVPEAVVDGVNGRLAGGVSAESLAATIFSMYDDARLREEMGVWGRLYAENEWSVEKAYHELHVALERGGILKRIGVGAKIRFVPVARELLAPVTLGLTAGRWGAASGFEPWEGPYPEQGLPRCRWMVGPVSRVKVKVTRPGIHHLRIVCTAFHPLAALRVVHQGRTVVETGIATHEVKREGVVVSCALALREGEEEIELHHWPWETAGEGREHSVLLFGMEVRDAHGERMGKEGE